MNTRSRTNCFVEKGQTNVWGVAVRWRSFLADPLDLYLVCILEKTFSLPTCAGGTFNYLCPLPIQAEPQVWFVTFDFFFFFQKKFFGILLPCILLEKRHVYCNSFKQSHCYCFTLHLSWRQKKGAYGTVVRGVFWNIYDPTLDHGNKLQAFSVKLSCQRIIWAVDWSQPQFIALPKHR